MFKKLGLRSRMLVTICTVALLAFALTIGIVTYMVRSVALEQAIATAEQTARRHSADSGTILNDAFNSASQLAAVFSGMKKSGAPMDRKVLDSILQSVLISDQNLLGVWTGWEPNALDGQDAQWVDKPGHDETGRYLPYFTNVNDKIGLRALGYYTQEGYGDYYLVPQRTGKSLVTEPYEYEVDGNMVMMVDFCVPIKVGSQVPGVAGVDLTTQKLQTLISSIKPYGTGDARLITSTGKYAAIADTKSIGKDIGTGEVWDRIKRAIKSGEEIRIRDYSKSLATEVERIMVPISLGDIGQYWGLLVDVPLDKVYAQANRITYITVIIGVVSMAVLFAVVFFIASGISNPIHRIVEGLGEGANQISMASQEVSKSSQSLAEGASQQAASLEETSASVEQITAMTRQNAANAGQADTLMSQTRAVVEGANKSMQNLVQAMDRINQASAETAKIIKTIDEIAFQTNLLALNAAVEAARAGEAGAGFAVVAEEVRNLALRAAEAAQNTTALIEGNIENIHQGVDLVNTTGEEFAKVSDSSNKVAELVAEIASASKEQADGLDQVNKATVEMDSVTQRVAASAEETAAASEELSAQAQTINGMVGDLVSLVGGAKEGPREK